VLRNKQSSVTLPEYDRDLDRLYGPCGSRGLNPGRLLASLPILQLHRERYLKPWLSLPCRIFQVPGLFSDLCPEDRFCQNLAYV